MTIGQKLTALRKARGMTQEELSEAIGITRQTISKWELDTSAPDLDYLCKLCDLFGVTADYLIRPEKENIERAERTEIEKTSVPPSMLSPSNTEYETSSQTEAPAKPPLNTRPAGWVMLGLAGLLLLVALISFVTDNPMPELMIFAWIAAVFALELLLIRWRPLFIVMWTAWLFWSCSQFVLTGRVIMFFIFSQEPILPINWAFIFTALWVLYTAFCIGVTVRLIMKYARARITKTRKRTEGKANK